ncbi:MAG: aminotransferase class III-fold pyridoxal phosphate-dependent enzyme, partial [Anaerolineae bacterium]
GLVYGGCHPSEVTLAELMIETIPCAEMARFLKSGAEGTAAAARLARAFTGREVIISSGYHGWHDWSLAKNPGVAGIPECLRSLTVDLPYGDYDRLEELFRTAADRIAAVFFAAPYHDEPANVGRFLQRARELTQQHGALLAYDEIVTGFRVATGGLGELVGVMPDLAVFSKGMANGFPIAAVVGRKDVMQVWDRAVISSTFGGETVSIAAAIACIGVHRHQHVTAALAEQGKWFKGEAEALGREFGVDLHVIGFDGLPVFELRGESQKLALGLHRTLLVEGTMPYFPMWYLSYSHTRPVLTETLAALRRSLQRVVEGRSA